MSAPVKVSEATALPPLTEAELVEIEALASKAQAGPWTVGPGPHYEIDTAEGNPLTASWFRGDAMFIAAARASQPRLLTDLRRAQKRIAELEAQIAATAEAHREDQRRADELSGVPG